MENDMDIKKLLKLQDELNILTAGENWKLGTTDKGREINWYIAITMETCELIDSLNWKHWSNINSKDNIDNAKLELADIWHFILSQMLVEGFDGKQYINFKQRDYNRDKVIYHSVKLIQEVVSPITARLSVILNEFNELMCMLFDSEEEFVKLYLGKSVLNRFRVANKYAEGKYIKIWVGGLEDNVYMQDFLEFTQDPDELYNLLKIEYAKVSDEVN